ncbi:MAG: hypothetical protein D6719_07240 [Candidatus Dadabacteria bacterium]|nr:MAG: hypothetical protein D6719_07240 [Candidatus Dadabacteria bacterium]
MTSITRIDCDFYRSPQASSHRSSYVALNPDQTPGSLVVAGSSAIRESIGSQVACKLALEHFVDGVLNYFEGNFAVAVNGSHSLRHGVVREQETSLQVLEMAFKRANSHVFDFGHKMAAGGRMSASLFGLVIEDNIIGAGRVGSGAAYLYRKGELYPFFESYASGSNNSGEQELVGLNPRITVELASVPVEESDLIFIFHRDLTRREENNLQRFAAGIMPEDKNISEKAARHAFSSSEEIDYLFTARIGPETIYLSQAV